MDIKHFRSAEIPRHQISKAPYNPRDIDAFALKKLDDGIKRFGLVEPLVWNERTGNLVGGHQRLSLLDARHNNAMDYLIPVAVVDLSETEERELNVLLNNPTTQGDWDMAKLEAMFRDDGASPFTAGFDLMDLQELFPTDTVIELMEKYMPQADIDALQQIAEIPGTPPPEALQQAAQDILDIKEARKNHKGGSREDLRSDHIVVMVFDSYGQAQEFLTRIDIASNQPFFLAEHLLLAMGRSDLLPPKETPSTGVEETSSPD